ncbi:MAG: hypothetical protein AUF64_02715 [Chloroflexi bacterium 13_1_20CM_54_36]|nr:MAG: hypothetical protein AUF64_02715 [Chloroflexi bacterium 13_1_20CM_54_36]
MKRQQQALSPGMPKSLQPGHYLSWQQRIYRVTALDPQQPLVIHVETIPGGERVQLALTTLFAAPQTGQDTPLFATSLEALDAQLAQRAVPLSEADPDELPASFLVKAQIIVQTVDMVSRLVQEDERRARGRREAWSRTQAVRRALATCEGAVIRVQMKDTSSEHILHPTFSTYYKYERLYRTCGGDCTRIAASFRRSTFRTSRLSRAQLHFSEMCLVLYYGNTRVTKTRAYQLARETLDHRTHGYWIDPERCGKVVPENLVTELLDPAIPMQALLDNPEKAALLTRITMPSRAWFCGYATYLEATADTGQQLMNQRLGQGVWEQYHLVFETFVHRAGLPLQYVFADHWLVNAWIVDEETRSQASRLWLTLLIDAYSRSIVGMALLSEEPCIESIQSALRHAIWHKSSHARLGLDGEWSCYGIPQQLFLDNAWAHHSHSLEHLARAISRDGVYNAIDLVFRPPYKGRYGAIIERVFRNFSGQIKELVAGAMASKSPQEVRAAAGRAWLLHTDLDRLLHQLILTYQHTPHRELNGMTPHQKWCEGIQTSGLPLIPAFTPEMDRLFLRLHPQTRQVRSRGIPAFGLNYWSAELGGIARRASDGSPVRYHFRYDPTDISRISLFRDGIWAGDGHARELQRADGTYRQVSLAEWQMAKRQVASRALDAEGKTPAELVLVTDLEVLSKQRAQEKRATQRAGARRAQPSGERQAAQHAPQADTDEETQRVLRFLYH